MDGFDFGNQCSAKRFVIVRCVDRLTAFTIAFAPVRALRKSVGIYMIINPVRAGLVNRPEEWPFQGQLFENTYWW
jgi:hypothetical protein